MEGFKVQTLPFAAFREFVAQNTRIKEIVEEINSVQKRIDEMKENGGNSDIDAELETLGEKKNRLSSQYMNCRKKLKEEFVAQNDRIKQIVEELDSIESQIDKKSYHNDSELQTLKKRQNELLDEHVIVETELKNELENY